MLCPRDKIVLNSINLKNIQIDICPSCHGIWLDKNEILKLIETDRNSLKLLEINSTETEQKKAEKLWQNEIECPRCKKLMQKFPYAGSSDIIIDSCRDGCGIWLDKGEILKIADFLSKAEKPLTDIQKAQVKQQLQAVQKDKSVLDLLNKRFYSQSDLERELDTTPAGNYMGIVYAILQGLMYFLFRKSGF